MRCEVGNKVVLGDASRLFKVRHPLSDFHKDVPFMRNFEEVILGNDFLRDELEGYAHVLKIFEGGTVIKILNVNCAEAGSRCRDDAIE